MGNEHIDYNRKYRLMDIHFVGDLETGWITAFAEDINRQMLTDVGCNIYHIPQVRDDDRFAVRYGIPINKNYIYDGYEALDILDQHKLLAATTIPNTYTAYRASRANAPKSFFATSVEVPTSDILKMCEIMAIHHEKEVMERLMNENGTIILPSINDGRDM